MDVYFGERGFYGVATLSKRCFAANELNVKTLLKNYFVSDLRRILSFRIKSIVNNCA